VTEPILIFFLAFEGIFMTKKSMPDKVKAFSEERMRIFAIESVKGDV